MFEGVTPAEGAVVSLQTAQQRQFLAEEARRSKVDGELTYRWDALEEQGRERSRPAPVRFAWTEDDPPEDVSLAGGDYFLLVGTDPALTQPHIVQTAGTAAEVYNLEIGRRYYWCVQHEGRRTAVRQFDTADEWPRCLSIDGISNVRDAGGLAVPGGRVRQGRVYRGGEFDRHQHLTAQGAAQLRALGVRTDLDLRGEADPAAWGLTPLLGIRRVLLPILPYDEILKAENQPALCAALRVFADPAAYPVYHHCWGGADRGGTVAFLLGALVGVPLTRLIDDYEFTTLGIWGIRTRNYVPFDNMVRGLLAFPGDTPAEKTAAFLRRIGLTQTEIDIIRDQLIEPDGTAAK